MSLQKTFEILKKYLDLLKNEILQKIILKETIISYYLVLFTIE